jgi:SnoaL-like domain
MDKAEIEAMVTRMFREMDPDLEYAMRHPEFEADMPQSGERFATRDALREMQRAFPDPPTITLRRVVGEGDVWVAEASSDYGGQRFHTVVIFEMRDDLILRETRYYAQPLDAPEWRSEWVENLPDR